MKIWIVNHYATSPKKGASTRHYALSSHLIALGHEVLIISSSSNQFPDSHDDDIDYMKQYIEYEENDVKFLIIPTVQFKTRKFGRLLNMLSFSWKVLRLSQQSDIPKPDIILGSSVHPFAAWAAERLSASFDIPFCFEVRDLWPQTLIDMKIISKLHPLSIFLQSLEKYLYVKSVKIISLLPYAFEYIQRYNISPQKVAYIPNGVDVKLFSGIPDITEREDITVMYLGSHGQANGVDTIIEAAAYFDANIESSKHLKWRFIGDGDFKEILQKKVTELGLHNIFFEDPIPKSKIPQLIAEADITILNLIDIDIYKYGISLNKIFDYLAAKRPTVIGCSARNNPIAEARSGITVVSGDYVAMAKAVDEIAKLPLEKRKSLGESGLQYVMEKHDYRILAKELERILEESIHMYDCSRD
jgi:glycosyltransferase involved in cell wall biosynthesis